MPRMEAFDHAGGAPLTARSLEDSQGPRLEGVLTLGKPEAVSRTKRLDVVERLLMVGHADRRGLWHRACQGRERSRQQQRKDGGDGAGRTFAICCRMTPMYACCVYLRSAVFGRVSV